MVLIDGRPDEVEGRHVPGHWEGDLIIGKDHKSALCVIVERRTRPVMLDRLLDYSAENVKFKVYFCHPHSPWEKATCENTNYLVRDMCHDETDLRKMSKQQVTEIARLLNERPKQTLGFYPPADKIVEIRAKSC